MKRVLTKEGPSTLSRRNVSVSERNDHAVQRTFFQELLELID